MPRFKAYNYDQQVMLAIDFRRQIQPGTFEWAINLVVDTRLDMAVFDHRFANDADVPPSSVALSTGIHG
ncbi:MAG: transposase [Salinisphaeraceae bacterium]|nr:transposase [Salinisphaeraceae bacterium]